MPGGRSYGPLCGIIVNGKRCYARGTYHGRCRDHIGIDDGSGTPPPVHRCLWKTTSNGQPCQALVMRAGDRCGKHRPGRVLQSAIRRRGDRIDALEATLAGKRARVVALNAEIARHEAELAELNALQHQARTLNRQAAE